MDTDGTGARTARPYGTWPSPVTPESLTARSVRLGEVAVDGDDTWWVESRPEEAGRSVLVRRTADGATTQVPAAMPDGSAPNVRSRVHEYGSTPFTVADGTVVFSHVADGRLYRAEVGSLGADGVPVPLTPAAELRFADPVIDAVRSLVYAVQEDHTGGGEPVNSLVAVPLDGSAAVRTVFAGTDFVLSPALSPDGTRVAWLAWDHPDMSWTAATLHVGTLADDGTLTDSSVVAGGTGVSVAQPVWTTAGDLVHVDDRTGWWNLYRTEAPGTPDARTRALHPAEAEFTPPAWQSPRTVDVLDEDHLVCAWTEAGSWHLGSVRLTNGELEVWPLDRQPAGAIAAGRGRVVLVAASPTRPPAVVQVDLAAHELEVLRSSTDVRLDDGDTSRAEPVSWTSQDGATAHGFFYPPSSSTVTGPADELPPLVVMTHGGPTAATTSTFRLGIQFWTTRGFAVLDVNYGGSTGYGRAYRERLDGAWGVVDVADCATGALHLAESGRVDGRRMAIRGGSAGGYTTLAALTFTEVFSAGASHYGIGDLEALARDTHKFESRYLDGLVGPYPAAAQTYRDRSPIHHTEQLTAPLVLLQGTEDKVVPPNQAETMAEAVRAKGLPVALVMFDGEPHGFRRAENIQAAALAELAFYGQVWGFEPAGELPVLDLG
ncbi:S9 family peptidase [Georgenia halophila]|uniref:S9 family peptidase n=1 Tax=Georgenia halophila TaxID=620889 RepID=A0ABP8LNV5_9MICO